MNEDLTCMIYIYCKFVWCP